MADSAKLIESSSPPPEDVEGLSPNSQKSVTGYEIADDSSYISSDSDGLAPNSILDDENHLQNTCQWEDCGQVFTSLEALVKHINEGKGQ